MGSALSRALSLLARRGYSEAELRKKLAGYPEAEVEAAIARLRDWGYLDDRAYAEAFVRSKAEVVPKLTLSPYTLLAAEEPSTERQKRKRIYGESMPSI